MALFSMSDNLNSLYKCRIVQEVVVVGLGVRKEIGTFDCSGSGSWLIHFFLTDAYDIVICVRFIMVMVWECNFNSYGIW